MAAVESFGGRVVLTRRDHPSGTDRVAEVARRLDAESIVNLQGDEPLIEPATLDLLPGLLEQTRTPTWPRWPCRSRRWSSGTTPTASRWSATPPAGPFTSAAAPSPSSATASPTSAAEPPRFLQHLGLYAYRRRFLLSLATLPPEPLEQLEKLEQLRVLALGRRIQVGVVDHAAIGVDTYDGLPALRGQCTGKGWQGRRPEQPASEAAGHVAVGTADSTD